MICFEFFPFSYLFFSYSKLGYKPVPASFQFSYSERFSFISGELNRGICNVEASGRWVILMLLNDLSFMHLTKEIREI